MAGDWIKMRGNLWDDPRVARLCDLTDSPEAMIVGGLYWLWATADQHSEDGVMPGLTLRSIDRKTGIQGFGQALCDIGWLADHPEGVRIIRFDEHNGISAKRRSTDAQRKSAVRGGEPATRKYITAGLKAKVFAMDGFKCVYCGRHKNDPIPANLNPAEFALSVDHLTPVSQGGDNSEENLVTACLPCNMSKNGRTPDEWGVVPDLSERIRTQQRQNAPDCGARERVREEIGEEPPNPLAGGESPAKPKRERKPRTSLQTFVDRCKTNGERLISEYGPLLEYVEATNLPMEFVQLCWEEFKGEFMPSGTKASRLQADWRGHFLNYVKKGYYRLWYAKPDGTFELSTAGIQARSFHDQKAAA